MSKHTPGPWEVHIIKRAGYRPSVWVGYREFVHYKLYRNGCVFELKKGQERIKSVPMSPANALLMAAAPELLEALQMMIDAHPVPSSVCKSRPAYDAAIAAIAKATGGES